MENNIDLSKIAKDIASDENAKAEVDAIRTEEVKQIAEPVNASADFAIAGAFDANASDDLSKVVDETSESETLTMDAIKQALGELPDEIAGEKIAKIEEELSKYKKDLIINCGMSPEEVEKAARSRGTRMAKKEYEDYMASNPNLAVVEIDKARAESLEFTPEEKEKLVKTKAIKLVMVEDAALNTLKVKPIKSKYKTKMLKELEGSLAQYSVPLITSTEFVTFYGAQTIQLLNAVADDNDSLAVALKKKAALIYNKYADGTVIHKSDADNATVLSYDEFINEYKTQDVNLGLYGIYVASSPEKNSTSLKCPTCDTVYEAEYNIKSLLHLNDIPKDFADKTNDILKARNNEQEMEKLRAKHNKAIRFKSTTSNNIYEVTAPSIAKSIKIFEVVEGKNQEELYHSAIVAFLDAMYIYDKSDDSYVELSNRNIDKDDDADETIRDMLTVIRAIPELDIQIIAKIISSLSYEPEFYIDSTCSNCGKKLTTPIDISQMVFLSAQNTPDVIK